MKKSILIFITCIITISALFADQGKGQKGQKEVTKMTLDKVRFWTYNIQDVNTERQRNELVGTHFDMYVLEPVTTEQYEENFDIAALVRDIREYNIKTRKVDPIILAYIDVGQAEAWRWYYKKSYNLARPSWIVGKDPDGWAGCFTALYWDKTWRDIVIYGYKGKSHVEVTLEAGFDGIYMDWVEAFSDPAIVRAAGRQGFNPAEKMFDFIAEIKEYARKTSAFKNPGYLIVAQNASDLYEENPDRYRDIMDAIACENVWYDGDGGFDEWEAPSGYNVLTNDINPGWTEEVVEDLESIKKHMPVFCVEYAQHKTALKAYRLAAQFGYIAYCSRRSLSRLSTTPYPPGYEPKDY